MSETIVDRFKHAWNVFMGRDSPSQYNNFEYLGPGSSLKPDRLRLNYRNDRTIVSSVLNRIATDAASIKMEHVRLDNEGRYLETINSTLNECLKVEANRDQSGRSFIQDVVLSMLDEGCVAIVPVDTNISPINNGSFDVLSMRTGKIVTWYPNDVEVTVYNDKKGLKENIKLPKKSVCIIENPFYSVMNEPNSTLQRLIRKLSLLDVVDEQSGSGKLDLIVQLPYVIKGETRKKQAEDRRADIERQLNGSKYGIAYTDGTEKITQLNRSVENNLLTQIKYLTDLLYSQLGITPEIMNGSAEDTVMTNYYSRIIEPILTAITDEMTRKFLTKTARSQRQAIMSIRNPFKLMSLEKIAEIADCMTRNEIMSSNEIRQIIGLLSSSDPTADQLRNKNLNQTENEEYAMSPESDYYDEYGQQEE